MTDSKSDCAPELGGASQARVRVGLCQVGTVAWDVVGNLARTLDAIAAAAEQGAEVAVTPECVLHGYAEQRGSEAQARLRAVAEAVDGPSVMQVRRQANACGVHVLLGFAEKTATGSIHNSAVLIGSDGAIRMLYRKVHCRSFESAAYDGAFTPGDQFFVETVTLREGPCALGVMICFDREIPESARCLRALGAQVVLCPLATDTRKVSAWHAEADNEMITRCRAAENEVFIVVVNHAGRFNGGSFVVGPGGEVLCQLGAAPEVRVVEVPAGVVAARYHQQPLGWMGWGYRRPDVYGRNLGVGA